MFLVHHVNISRISILEAQKIFAQRKTARRWPFTSRFASPKLVTHFETQISATLEFLEENRKTEKLHNLTPRR